LVKHRNFGQKSKFWLKTKFWSKHEIFSPKSNQSEIFNPDSSKHECPLCPRKYFHRGHMHRHVKESHLLSLREAFQLSQNISEGKATADDIPRWGSRRISSDTRKAAPANSQSWKYFAIYGAKVEM